jgi:accessory gene regulator B
LLAYFFGEMKQLLVFLVLFIPLRIFAGGYHAETRTACYVISVMIVFTVLSVLRHATSNLQIWMILILSSYSVIFFLSPRENVNKPLSTIEKKTYRIRSLILLNVECITVGFSLYFRKHQLFQCTVLALAVVALLLIADWTSSR